MTVLEAEPRDADWLGSQRDSSLQPALFEVWQSLDVKDNVADPLSSMFGFFDDPMSNLFGPRLTRPHPVPPVPLVTHEEFPRGQLETVRKKLRSEAKSFMGLLRDKDVLTGGARVDLVHSRAQVGRPHPQVAL